MSSRDRAMANVGFVPGMEYNQGSQSIVSTLPPTVSLDPPDAMIIWAFSDYHQREPCASFSGGRRYGCNHAGAPAAYGGASSRACVLFWK